MTLTVTSAREPRPFRTFQRLPWSIYGGLPLWVPPILKEEAAQFREDHPFFRHGEVEPFLAWRGERPVGRIAAIANRAHLERHDDGKGFFGFFEAEDDPEVVSTLFEAAGKWLGERGCRSMMGPVQFTMNDVCGVLIDGFDVPPAILMPYNPPYYPSLLERAGMRRSKGLLAYRLTEETVLPAQLKKVAAWAERKGIRARTMNLRNFDAEVERVRRIYNEAWDQNWGYEPMTEEEFKITAKDLRRVADPRLLFLVERKGEPVGFSVSVPNYNPSIRCLNGRYTPWGILKAYLASRRVKDIRTMALGVIPRYRRRGVDALLIRETVERGLGAGYTNSELSWVLDDNALMNDALVSLGSVVEKRYALYERDL